MLAHARAHTRIRLVSYFQESPSSAAGQRARQRLRVRPATLRLPRIRDLRESREATCRDQIARVATVMMAAARLQCTLSQNLTTSPWLLPVARAQAQALLGAERVVARAAQAQRARVAQSTRRLRGKSPLRRPVRAASSSTEIASQLYHVAAPIATEHEPTAKAGTAGPAIHAVTRAPSNPTPPATQTLSRHHSYADSPYLCGTERATPRRHVPQGRPLVRPRRTDRTIVLPMHPQQAMGALQRIARWKLHLPEALGSPHWHRRHQRRRRYLRNCLQATAASCRPQQSRSATTR